VPLRAGGTIPVSLVGTSAPGGDDKNPVVTLLQQSAQDDVTRDALLGQHNDKLDLILGQLTTAFPKAETFYQNALNVFNTLLASYNTLASKISSGGGGGGGGGSYSGGTGGLGGGVSLPTDQGTDINSVFRQVQAQISQLDSQKNTKFLETMAHLVTGFSGGPAKAPVQYLYDQYYKSDTFKQNQALDLQATQLAQAFDAQFGAGAYSKMVGGNTAPDNPLARGNANGGPLSFGRGFATGSPNASKDTSGGFVATLHPDEAVIPLPDGRSVPVNLSADVEANLAAIKAMLGSANRVVANMGTSRVAAQMQSLTNNNKVTMIIQTPDANSFRKSQPQIVADLRGQLQRAQQTSGAIKRLTEDPTKRIITRQ
jgi:hypothetical protein